MVTVDIAMGTAVRMTYGTRRVGSVEGINYSDSSLEVWFHEDDSIVRIHTSGLELV